MSNVNKLLYSQINEKKNTKPLDKFDKSKKLKNYNESNFDNDIDKNYILVMFKGRKLKIKKKPRISRNSDDVKINLKNSNLQMIIDSNHQEKNEKILNFENEKNITGRKSVVEQYKNLLKKLNFSPSQKFYNSTINKQKEQKTIERMNEKKNDKKIINKTEKKINIKLTYNEKNFQEINLEKSKKKYHRRYKSLSRERDKYKALRLKNNILEEEKNSHSFIYVKNKLNKLASDFQKEKERKNKVKNRKKSKSLNDFNLKGRNLLNRVRNLKKLSQ